MKKTQNQQIIADDILRYKTNKLASTLALLGLVFNCLYFCLLYSINNNYFNVIEIGVSVVLTLVLLLVMFLSSEGVKGYNKKYSIVLIVVAVIQIIRIFGLPMGALRESALTNVNPTQYPVRYFGIDLAQGVVYALMVVYLVASAACLIASAVLGYIYARRLEVFQAKVDSGEISIENTLKEMDAEDEGNATQVAIAAEAQSEEITQEVQ